jgi:hypothetical protein
MVMLKRKGIIMKKRIAFLTPFLIVVLAFSTLLVTPISANVWLASTIVNIQGPTAPVPAGTAVTLIITETNNSNDPATELWLSEPWVSLEPGGYILNRTSSYFYGGDDKPLGHGNLEVGETWEWRVDVTINADSLFTVIGHGYIKGYTQYDVTYGVLDPQGNMAYPYEKDEFMVTVIREGGEGLTPGYWKNHLAAWGPTGYVPTQYFDNVFGVGPHVTLLKALQTGGGGAKALGRHATAALLNAGHPNISYDLSKANIIAMVRDAYATGDFEGVKDVFEGFNELEGDINS